MSSIASGSSSQAHGIYAEALHDETYVWSSTDNWNLYRNVLSSTTNKQYSVFAENGIRLLVGDNAIVDIETINPSKIKVSAPGKAYDGLTLEQFILNY